VTISVAQINNKWLFNLLFCSVFLFHFVLLSWRASSLAPLSLRTLSPWVELVKAGKLPGYVDYGSSLIVVVLLGVTPAVIHSVRKC